MTNYISNINTVNIKFIANMNNDETITFLYDELDSEHKHS